MCVLLFFGKYNSKGGYKILSSKRGTIKHLKNNKYKAVWYFPDNTSVSKTFDTKIASENWLDIQRALYGNEIYQGNKTSKQLNPNEIKIGKHQFKVKLFNSFFKIEIESESIEIEINILPPQKVENIRIEMKGSY